jgi:hypothetical protein
VRAHRERFAAGARRPVRIGGVEEGGPELVRRGHRRRFRFGAAGEKTHRRIAGFIEP